jgi:hypothetical protein
VVDDLVRRLANHEARYQDVTIRLMLEVARCPTSLMSSASKSPTERSDSTRRSPRKKPRLQRSSLVYEFTDAPYMPSQRCHPQRSRPPESPRCCTAFHETPGAFWLQIWLHRRPDERPDQPLADTGHCHTSDSLRRGR